MGFGIGQAVKEMQDGKKVARAGWNGKGMFIIFIPGTLSCPLKEGTPYEKALKSENFKAANIKPHIDMFTAKKEFQPGWLASQEDLMAIDWEIVA